MKKIILALLAFIIILFWGCATTSNTVVVVHHPNPTFADLDSYGEWVNIPGMGTVWRPDYQNDWQPYSNGYWAYTNDGWMWVSNEPYGWIVYHYGYWNYDESLGWVWIPSYDWQPARVSWYHSNGYIGWAPLPPPSVNQTVIYNVHVTNIWVVVPEQHFVSHSIIQYRTRTVTPDIQVIRSQDGGRAPDVGRIEQVTNTRIEPIKPVREELTAGNRRIIKVRMPEDRPVSPSTIRNEPTVPTTPTVNPPARNEQRPNNNPPRKEPVYQNNPPRPVDNGKAMPKEKVRESGRSNVGDIKKEDRSSVKKQQLRNEPKKNKSEVRKSPTKRSVKEKPKEEKDKKKQEENK